MEAKRGSFVPRPALADVTNQTKKRAVEVDLQDLPVSKQICLGLENSGCLRKNGVPPSLADDEVRKQSFVCLSVAGEVEGLAAVDNLPVNAVIVGDTDVIELDVVSRDSCSSVPLIHLESDLCNVDSAIGLMSQKTAVRTPVHGGCLIGDKDMPLDDFNLDKSLCNVDSASGLMSQKTAVRTPAHGGCQIGDKDMPLDDFNLDKGESSESEKSVKPNTMPSFGLERCTSLKEGNDSNSAASAADMLKTCSCSFCLKAAYIWSDLHYQDVKGRISAAKKSKKESVSMIQKICAVKETSSHDQGISDKTSKLESALSSQWRSLFLHMEEAFARESNHLQDNFLALKELRENCKSNLEMIDAKPAEHD